MLRKLTVKSPHGPLQIVNGRLSTVDSGLSTVRLGRCKMSRDVDSGWLTVRSGSFRWSTLDGVPLSGPTGLDYTMTDL